MCALKICADDPLAKALSQDYGAQLLHVPTTAVRPGTVIQYSNGRVRPLDDLTEYLAGDSIDLNSALDLDSAASIAGERSREVDVDLGLKILTSAMEGLKIPAPGNVSAALSMADTLQFSIGNVEYRHYGQARLGKLLKGRSIDMTSPAAGAITDTLRFVDGC